MMAMHYTTETFIEKAKTVHGDKYDYSKVDYVNSTTKICIICPKHGEFWQKPSSHLQGHGCPKCATDAGIEFQKSNTEEFIKKAREIHGDRYDYSKVNYVNNHTKVCIICEKHGEFWQKPSAHLSGGNCYKCGKESMGKSQSMTKKEFIERARKIHGEKYDYSKVEYLGANTKVCIICPEHGEFLQTPSAHINGKEGCPVCGNKLKNQVSKLTTEEFVEKAKKIHGNKYDYSNVEYVDYDTKVKIICPEHGEFWQSPDSHLQGKGCRLCNWSISKAEEKLISFINNELGIETINHDRTIISPYELDIYIPSLKIGIEYNGLFWHSEYFGKDKNYHLNKLNVCNKKGIKLIQIFEDEYINKQEIVLGKIKHLLGKSDVGKKIYGRNCIIKEISSTESKNFLEKSHIQGFSRSTTYLGAYNDGKLVGVMNFLRESKDSNKWELNRFATDNEYICCGIGGKMFKYFITNYNPEEIKSFADRRWTINEGSNVYIKLGFNFNSFVPPDYSYFCQKDGLKRQHKFNFRKQILHKKYGLPLSMTENEMTKKLKCFKIWNCGLIKYVWKNEDLKVNLQYGKKI